jgi:hypothetical protein
VLVAVLGVLGFAAATTTAMAGSPLQFGACDDAVLTQPFAAYGDLASYKLVPGGDFEAGAPGWGFANGGATGDGGRSGEAAVLPAGASVTSPATCVNAAYPKMRFFARTTSGGPSSALRVDLLYRDGALGLIPLPIGLVTQSGDWTPTRPIVTLALAAGAVNGGQASLALRFTALRGNWAIDDVFVDPYSRG